MNHMRSILAAVLGVLLIAATYPPFAGKPVIDQADLLSAEQEAQLNRDIIEYKRAYQHEIAVVTINSLEGLEPVDYAQGLFRTYKIGRKGADDGMLLLVAPNERKVWIHTGYGMHIMLTDAKAKGIIEETILPRFREKKMDAGILEGAAEMIRYTSKTPAQIEAAKALQRRLDAKNAQEAAVRSAKTKDFFMTLLGFMGLGGSGYGIWFLATNKKRKERRAAAAEAARLAREAQIARQREHERLAAIAAEEQRKAHEAWLASLSPAELAAYKEEQRRIAEQRRLAAIAAAEEAERRRIKREREAAIERAREEAEERSRPRTTTISTGSSTSNSNSDSGFSFGGGDSGGSGAGGSW